MQTEILSGPGRLQGEFVPPGDKSVSHRAVMFGALADGVSSFTHFLEAGDCLSTVRAFQALGVPVRLEPGTGRLEVAGVGLHGLKAPEHGLDMGNAGTTTRLLMGILAGQPFEAALFGDESLSARPMRRVTDPLKQMGAQIKGRDKGNFLPLSIRGGKLKGIAFDNPLSSAQVKSAVLLAGLYADGTTVVREPVPSRDHTERFLLAAKAPFDREGDTLRIRKAERLCPVSGEIPGDFSSASFFIAGAAMTEGSELTVRGVCLNPTRTGFLDVLKRMGAKIEVTPKGEVPEPIGDIRVLGSRLRGTRVRPEEIPSLIDELPVLMVLMSLSQGESLVSGAGELRVKETDRIQAMVQNLKAVGASIEELPDGCMVRGIDRLNGGTVQSYADHRTAMSLAVASLACRGEIRIENTDCVAISFPGFFADFLRLRQSV